MLLPSADAAARAALIAGGQRGDQIRCHPDDCCSHVGYMHWLVTAAGVMDQGLPFRISPEVCPAVRVVKHGSQKGLSAFSC
jgi:hypothetical protein